MKIDGKWLLSETPKSFLSASPSNGKNLKKDCRDFQRIECLEGINYKHSDKNITVNLNTNIYICPHQVI